MSEGLEIRVAGSYPIKFGSGLASTGPEDGEHRDGMMIDTWHSWSGKQMFCGGVMGYKDVIRLRDHLDEWLGMRIITLEAPDAKA